MCDFSKPSSFTVKGTHCIMFGLVSGLGVRLALRLWLVSLNCYG